jgi:hypothetical protein
MAETDWPDIRQEDAALHAHAAQLKVDIARLNQRLWRTWTTTTSDESCNNDNLIPLRTDFYYTRTQTRQ